METTTQEAKPADLSELAVRQTGIKPWSQFSARTTTREPDEAPKHGENSLKGLSREQMKEWRDSGELPEKEAEAETKDGTVVASAESNPTNPLKDLTREERKTWREKGTLPAKSDEASKTAADSEASKAATTPQTHDQRFQEFHSSAQQDVETRTDLSKIYLDAERGALVGHVLADIPAATRRQVIKALANRPDLQRHITSRQTAEQVVAAVHQLANSVGPRPLTPEQRNVADTWVKRTSEYSAANHEFKQILEDLKHPVHEAIQGAKNQNNVGPGRYVEDFILESEQGPAILHHLAKNPDALKEVLAPNLIKQNRALVKLEIELGSAKVAAKPKTQAPPPVREVGGRGTSTGDPLVAEAKAHPGVLTRSAKAEANRQYAARNR